MASGLLLSLPSARERAISKRGETNMATKKHAKPVRKAKKLGNVKSLKLHASPKVGPVAVLSNKNPFTI